MEIEAEGDLEMEDNTITQEDSWLVADAYFLEKGLVRQQLSSFSEFVAHTVQEMVASQVLELKPQEQFKPGKQVEASKVPSPSFPLPSTPIPSISIPLLSPPSPFPSPPVPLPSIPSIPHCLPFLSPFRGPLPSLFLFLFLQLISL